jgi:hypothetical protein
MLRFGFVRISLVRIACSKLRFVVYKITSEVRLGQGDVSKFAKLSAQVELRRIRFSTAISIYIVE